MPFCPICKKEYGKGVNVCSDCGCELVDTIVPEPSVKIGSKIYINDEPAFLVTGSSEIDCEIIEGSLNSACIPFLKKDREIGGYMRVFMGYSVFGSDFYVPSKLLAKAKQALDASSVPGGWGSSSDCGLTGQEEQNGEKCEDDAGAHVGRTVSKFVVAVIIAILIFGFLGAYIIYLIKSF